MYDNWEQLEADANQCRKCKLCQNRTNVVFGTGNKQADLMFIGEGPGADEDKQGIPFVEKKQEKIREKKNEEKERLSKLRDKSAENKIDMYV